MLTRSARTLVRALVAVPCAAGAMRAQLPATPASSPAPITVGGYAALTVTRSADSSRIRIAEGNIAAIISGSLTARLSYLAELDAVSSSRENYAGRQDDRQLEFARLYAEVTQSDLLRLRVGRFLTPIGQWNEIHAEPLTWSAVRPLATYRSFAKYSTGALLAGQGSLLGRDAGYALWGAPQLKLSLSEAEDEELQFRGAYGARVALEAARGIWLGLSGAAVRERRPSSSLDDDSIPELPEPAGALRSAPTAPDFHEGIEDPPGSDDRDEGRSRALLGADLTARLRGFEFRAEFTYLAQGLDRPAERTAFAQLAAPLGRGLHAVVRAEDAYPLTGRDIRFWSAGLHWRLPTGVVLKLERQDAANAPTAVANGWYLSVSTRF